MESIGSMRMNLKHRNAPNRPAVSADSATARNSQTETEHTGTVPTVRDSVVQVPTDSQTSSNKCSDAAEFTDGNGTYWYSSDGEGFSGASADGFSDFFEQMFGRRRSGGQQAGFRGQDFHAELHLTLREAAQTHKQVLNVNGKQVRITIPAGVADGQVIKLKGYGAAGVNGGPAGDLYITFVIAEDTTFKRLGDDLYVDAEIDLYSAVLGGEKIIDTLNGKVKLKIKPETQNGTKVRLKGKGFPVYKEDGQFGDLIVTYSVKIPTGLNDRQKELFRQLQSMN